ncbi:TonB family protein [Halioglobus sp. HI00S01]|uniref:TonB family protein n=2 Tax=Halioglobus sp. HI00S01 TaxID=1822214 RepID=UPI0018D2B558|nr:TonB family protein [Halioglobus sp. HI00S01]
MSNDNKFLKKMVLGKLFALVAAAFMSVSSSATSVDNVSLRGAAVHTDTGREVYVGGLLLASGVSQSQTPSAMGGPRVQEFRILARRSSPRSLMGAIVLQGQVAASLSEPSSDVVAFASQVIANIPGSLYRGDIVEVILTRNGNTIARLNGFDIAETDGRSVADFFLGGWVGDEGPTKDFSSAIRGALDASVAARFNETSPNQTRQDELAAVFGPSEEPEPTVIEAPAEKPPVSRPEPVRETVAAATPQPKAPAPKVPAKPRPRPAVKPADDAVASIGITEYSERLAKFHEGLMIAVYTTVQYPRVSMRRSQEGRVEMDLTLGRDGSYRGVKAVSQSAYKALNKEAVRAVTSVAKKGMIAVDDPVVIAEYGDGDNLIIPVPIIFQLQ